MNKRIIFIIIAVFTLLIAAALVFDSTRVLENAYDELRTVDQEIQKQERRYIDLAKGNTELSAGLTQLIESYGQASNLEARGKAFQNLTSKVNQNASGLDVTNPMQRRLMDDLLGAANRRQVALQSYDATLKTCNEISSGMRGKIARTFNGYPERCDLRE